MKIILLALFMCTITLFAAPAAIAAPGSGDNYFVEAKVGSASIWSGGTQASSPELLGGYRWDTGSFGKLGFELGYVDFSEIDSGTPSISFAFGGATFKGRAIKAGVNLNYTIGQYLYLEPRLGLMRLSYTGVQRNFPNNDINYSETKIGHYIGIGVGAWFTPNFAMSLNFDNHTADILGQTQTINVFSLGAQFQF
ncbi:MAG TPA: outer membrane beta-barrel protein [Gammaproteobacteria bacterium]|nr:outer membrane beta-barrel protein [Gammaproteobacteria bacterium]